jgi:hypothetical protein
LSKRLTSPIAATIDAGDRHQPFYPVVSKRRAREVVLDDPKVLAQPVELAQMPLDGKPLIRRHHLIGQPGSFLCAAQILMRTRRDQVTVGDRLNDVFQP